jgi:predicted transcriptional regulator
MAVLTAMVSAGCTDEQMAAVVLDRSLPIGEHVRDQPKMVAYLTRQIKYARAVASPGQRVEVKIKADLDDVLKSAADLQYKKFEELRWVIPKYLPEGCALLAGRPKVGKSWLGLDAGIAVSSGGACMGQQCEQGDVLGLFLEDTDRRLQRRMTMMLGAYKDSWPASLTYATGWPRLNERGLDWMRRWVDGARKPRLIIIDILERIRQRTKKDDRQSQYSADYEALVSLQELSAEAQLSILTLVHQRKLGAEDLIDTVSGTLGLGGAVDTVLILGKDQQLGKFLYGRGRDLEEFNVTVQQNDQCRWRVLGPKVEGQSSPERAQIVAALARAGRPMNVKEISEAVGGKYPNVKQLLAKLHAGGEVERVSTGLYKLPNPQEDPELPF